MSYIHGFDAVEQKRLVAQAEVLAPKIFERIDFSDRKHILEVGSGVGAQTGILLNKYPKAHVTGIELSEAQFTTAQTYLSDNFSADRYSLHLANAEQMPFQHNSFDAIYICWVLEHVSSPQKIIDECYRVLVPGGLISITEVQNNNLYIVPKSTFLEEYWHKYNQLQLQMGGNPFVGVEVGNYLHQSGFQQNNIYSQTFLYDNNTPHDRSVLIEYWTNLMLSGFDNLLLYNMVKAEDRSRIISEMAKARANNGVFHYSFIQAAGVK